MIIYRLIALSILIGISYIGFFTNFIVNLTNDQIITILSSFSGAAFAYFFVVLNEKINKELKRKEDHYNSLVLTERYLITLLNISQSNRERLEKFTNIITIPQKTILTFQEFSIRENVSENTKNKILINDFLNLIQYYSFINQHQSNIVQLYLTFQESIRGTYSSEPEYLKLLGEIGEKMKIQTEPLLEHYKKVENETVSVLAKYRVAMKGMTLLIHKIPFLKYFFENEFHLPKKYERKVAEEKAKINEEISKILSDSA